jgi:chemotaxis protein CheX
MNATLLPAIDEIRTLVGSSVVHVFETMLGVVARPAPLYQSLRNDEASVAASVGFIGEVKGVIYLNVPVAFARQLAARMMGAGVAEVPADEMVNDVVGELTNMIAGAAKSRLCDLGSPCVLTIPFIVRGEALRVERTCACECHALGFLCEGRYFVVELLVEH